MTTEATTAAQVIDALRDAAETDAPILNAYLATTADDLFAALESQHYSEGWWME